MATEARLALAVELDSIDYSEDTHSVDELVAVRDQLIRIAADALDECQRLERTLDEVAEALRSARSPSAAAKVGRITNAVAMAGYEVPTHP